jgi:hypothetical protein
MEYAYQASLARNKREHHPQLERMSLAISPASGGLEGSWREAA